MGRYIKDVQVVFFANVVSFLAGVGIQASLAWFLLPEGRGQYAACVVVFALILTLIFSVGQEMANVYYVGSNRITASQALTNSLLIGFFASILSCTTAYILTFLPVSIFNKAPLELFRFSILAIPPTIFFLYLSRIFLGMSVFRVFTVLSAGSHLVNATGLLFFSLFGLTVKRAILIYAGSQGLMALTTLFILYFRYGCRFEPVQFRSLFESLHYGLRFHLGKLCAMANVQIGTIVLAFLNVDTENLGLYAAASALASRVWLVPDTIQVAMLPRTSADPKGQSRMIAQNIRLCLLVCAGLVLFLFISGRLIIGVILSPRFLPALTAFWILLPGVWIRVIPKILAAYFNGMDHPQITSLSMLAAIVTNFVLIYYLYPVYGLVGVALSNTTAFAIEAILMTTFFCRMSRLPVVSLFAITKQDRVALTGIIYSYFDRFRKRSISDHD